MNGQAVDNPIITKLKNLPTYANTYDKGYVYIIDNGENIKVGSTTNLYERMVSLSNSNGGGFTIKQLYYSPACYIYKSLEKAMHIKLKKYSIIGEWFHGITFEHVCNKLNILLNSDDFKRCEEAKMNYYNFSKKDNTAILELEN